MSNFMGEIIVAAQTNANSCQVAGVGRAQIALNVSAGHRALKGEVTFDLMRC